MTPADVPPPKADLSAGGTYTVDEIGLFFSALASARDRFGHVTRELSRAYDIGPRGPWMVGLIGRQPVAPHELATFLGIGRSLVTAELRQLQAAGLINYVKGEEDRRTVTLSLTPRGDGLREKLIVGLGDLLERRLAGHSREAVMACAHILRDFALDER